MKKLYSLLGMALVSSFAFGQAQRFVIAEEFTQASCPPCASQNPGFNALLDANDTKIIGLKYQVWWPGYDPMYNHNKPDVDQRVGYYAVNGVPYAFMDGATVTGGGYTGAPNGLTQGEIDARYAVTSPFTITTSHSFDAGMTQMTINADITCMTATTGTLLAHVAIMEREIAFASPPGSNGETDFSGVMKKMVPDAFGTAVTAVTAGATQNLNFVVDIPWYTYDLNELAVVVFIQNDGTKAIHQVSYSAPIGGLPVSDMAITTFTGVPSLTCATSFSPVVTIKNNSSALITSCNVNYQIDGGTIIATPWSGSLAQNATDQVTLNGITAPAGQHSLRVFTSDLNTGIDISPVNNNQYKNFAFASTPIAPPVTEGFVGTTFPPVDWIVNDANADGTTWARVTTCGGFGLSSEAAKMDCWTAASGRIDELFIKKLDMQNWSSASAMLTFNLAYKQYSTLNDKLEILVSTNCGTNWTSLYNKQGAALSSSPGATGNPFTPTATQWRFESVDLSTYIGNPDVLIKFKATSNNGNNIYLDDINLFSQTGLVEGQLEESIRLYPSLSTGTVNMDIDFDKAQNLEVIVYNAMGQEVLSKAYGNTIGGTFVLDLSGVANGNYTVRIFTDEAAISKSVSIAR